MFTIKKDISKSLLPFLARRVYGIARSLFLLQILFLQYFPLPKVDREIALSQLNKNLLLLLLPDIRLVS